MGKSMFLEKIHSEGLAHISYLIGHGGKAAVIDPRRDCRVYVEKAHAYGASIEYIFETHRNEDYVIGSVELAGLTGARILHGRNTDFKYGVPVAEGDAFEVGDLSLTILETPGHTFESISIVLSDRGFGSEPVAVFTGDALFIGDVGRTDFFPDRAEEVAGLLYDSIFDKILPLGDHVLLYPAHGAGSVCGESMADREFSTLGYERKNNPVLQKRKREEFIRYKVNEHHYAPPYFRQMEIYNQEGSAAPVHDFFLPRPFSVKPFEQASTNGGVILDARSPEAIGGALIPGSIGIPLEMIPAFAGYFLPYDKDILIVLHDYAEADKAARYLSRLGYDRLAGFLEEGLHAWETSGKKYQTIPSITSHDLVRKMERQEDFTLLDVRKIGEVNAGKLPGAVHVFVGELPGRLDAVPKNRPVVTFCGSGQRAVIAATILKRNGYEQVENCLGSMAACEVIGCPVVREKV